MKALWSDRQSCSCVNGVFEAGSRNLGSGGVGRGVGKGVGEGVGEAVWEKIPIRVP